MVEFNYFNFGIATILTTLTGIVTGLATNFTVADHNIFPIPFGQLGNYVTLGKHIRAKCFSEKR